MPQGQVRIIGGKWRGRKLAVPELEGLRPTPDRVRETLFNWLAPLLPGAHCLDLFAGSGALGFEALSRGASKVVMVDQARQVIQLLKEEAQKFGATEAEFYQAKLPGDWSFLSKTASKTFDLVFLDPPYREALLLPLCSALEEKHLLAATAYIYLESATALEATQLPPGWTLLKSKKAGQVSYYLAKRQA